MSAFLKDIKNYRKKFIEYFFTKTSTTAIEKIMKKKRGEHVDFSPKDDFILEISQPLAEIESVYSLLLFSPIIINSTNYNYVRKGVSAVEQFKYHWEFYINQLYILNQRLNKILDILIKKTKNEEKNYLKNKKKQVNNSFDAILKVRGAHVHDRKYSDPDLYNMELIDKALTIEKKINKKKRGTKEFEQDLKFYLSNNRKKWKKTMLENNQKIEELLDNLYYNIFEDSNNFFNITINK